MWGGVGTALERLEIVWNGLLAVLSRSGVHVWVLVRVWVRCFVVTRLGLGLGIRVRVTVMFMVMVAVTVTVTVRSSFLGWGYS